MLEDGPSGPSILGGWAFRPVVFDATSVVDEMTRVRQLATGIALVLALASAVGAQDGRVVDRVLAVVGAQVVTLSDARAVLEFGLVQPPPGADPTAEALEYLINRQLMLSEVDRYSAPSPDSTLLARRMVALRARFASDEAYARALARCALTETRLRDLVGDNLRIESYLEQRFAAAAQPTAEEVDRYYVDHRAEFSEKGRLLPLDEVRAQATARVTAERRSFLIAEWLDRVRRRFAITNSYTPVQK